VYPPQLPSYIIILIVVTFYVIPVSAYFYTPVLPIMGLLKLLLKAILIPIVVLVVITVVIVLLIKMRRDRKKKEKELEGSFQPPPIQQWVPYTPVQQPAPAYAKTPGTMEQGIGPTQP
jgi:type VI protein secretion system component VasK